MAGEPAAHPAGDDSPRRGDGRVPGGETTSWGVSSGFAGGGRGADPGELVPDPLFRRESGMIRLSTLLLAPPVGERLRARYDDYRQHGASWLS
ncbi:hypothetical protein, partial [Klebsiella pneumoniae]|uniref:hypothetical protein n=1 Tax=Klebsiella pneumoniae TaxID=573 RepID=UPI003F584D68